MTYRSVPSSARHALEKNTRPFHGGSSESIDEKKEFIR